LLPSKPAEPFGTLTASSTPSKSKALPAQGTGVVTTTGGGGPPAPLIVTPASQPQALTTVDAKKEKVKQLPVLVKELDPPLAVIICAKVSLLVPSKIKGELTLGPLCILNISQVAKVLNDVKFTLMVCPTGAHKVVTVVQPQFGKLPDGQLAELQVVEQSPPGPPLTPSDGSVNICPLVVTLIVWVAPAVGVMNCATIIFTNHRFMIANSINNLRFFIPFVFYLFI
jgi:hypothetical protein